VQPSRSLSFVFSTFSSIFYFFVRSKFVWRVKNSSSLKNFFNISINSYRSFKFVNFIVGYEDMLSLIVVDLLNKLNKV